MKMALKVTGVASTKRKMLRRARNLRNTRGVNGRIITDWFAVVQRNFQSGGQGRWRALKPATRKQKQAMGRDGGILIRFGNLRQQWIIQSNDKGGRLFSTTSYAMVHEKGSRKRNIPKRKMLPTLRKATAIATKHLGRHIKKSIRVS